MNNDISFNLKVKDVHEFAAGIASDFDKLSEICGIGEITNLINKVISVLELLEMSVVKVENSENEIADLKLMCEKILKDKLLSENSKHKLEHEFEEIEKIWEVETKQLKSVINSLQERNQQLINVLDRNKTSYQHIGNPDDKAFIIDQQNTIFKLSRNLKGHERELKNSIANMEILNLKLEQLQKANESLHTEIQNAKREIFKIQEQNVEQDLKTVCDQNQADISTISCSEKYCLHEFMSAEDDLTNLKVDEMKKCKLDNIPSNVEIINQLQKENYDLQDEVHKLEQELASFKIRAKYYKDKFESVSENRSLTSLQKSNGIRQLFHLFLGVVSF